jgi:hypothetical protein
MRNMSKTVHDINKMEDNFVFTYPGIISRAELVPSHGASRRRLGDNFRSKFSLTKTLQKEALYLLKSFKTTKYFITLLQMYITTGDIQVSSKLFRQFKLNVAEQESKTLCKKVIFLASYFCVL